MIGNNRTIAMNAALAASVLLLCVSSPSCTTPPPLAIHQSDTLTIMLRELPAGYPSLAPFHYVHVIEPSDTFALLESLAYEANSLVPFSQGQRHHVFTRNQAASLAPELSKALNLALPHEVAAFSVSDAEQPRRHTKGFAFVHGDELHLIIEELRRPRYEGAQNPYEQQGSRWSLLPGDGQRHYSSHPGGTDAMTNWIITPLR